MPITVTFDLEDSRTSPVQPERFALMTDRFLEFAAELGIRTTMFVVGELARSHPALIRRVADAGHEVALHGLYHRPIADIGPGRFGEQVAEGRALLEDVTQTQVTGFRAPIFSLTPAVAWAVDELAEAGFNYSSSVLPASNPLFGWPGAPRGPFRWPNGLIELPCPVIGVGRVMVPYLGGIYLRYVPKALTARLLSRSPNSAGLWTYSHPYDIDPDEPFGMLPNAGWVTSRILHTRRHHTLRRLKSAVQAAGGASRPLTEIVAGLDISARWQQPPLVR